MYESDIRKVVLLMIYEKYIYNKAFFYFMLFHLLNIMSFIKIVINNTPKRRF